MTRLGRHAWRAALAAFGVLAVAACSGGTVVCSPCGGKDSLDPNGVISAHDQVASVRVCINSVCQTVEYQFDRRPLRYANIASNFPRNNDRFESIEITTFDAHHKVVRVANGTSIDLPKFKTSRDNPCACRPNLNIAYDNTSERFLVTTQ